MKVRLAVLFLLIILAPLYAQNLGNLNFINSLGEKDAATYGDAVTFFILMDNQNPGSFNANLNRLNRNKITTNIKYGEQSTLNRGTLALMVARYLNLKDSLFYLISGSGRYAFQACVSQGYMDPDGSEWDPVSGEELIEIMGKVSEKREARR